MNKLQLVQDNVSDSLQDLWLQVRAKFTLSDKMRELLSTVTRGWVIMQVTIVLLFLLNCAISLAQSEWYKAWLHFMIAALFAVGAFHEMLLNVYKKRYDMLVDIASEQQKTMREMLNLIEGTDRGSEFD